MHGVRTDLPSNDIFFTSHHSGDVSQVEHNPANVRITFGNSINSKTIVKIIPKLITMPKLFQTISPYNNELYWWKKKVGGNSYEIYKKLTIVPGVYNIKEVTELITAFRQPEEVWDFDDSKLTVQISRPDMTTSIDGPITWEAETYVSSGSKETLTTLGIRGQYNKVNGISEILAEPLFIDSVTPYTSPRFEPPSMGGPSIVHVLLAELAQSNMVDVRDGTPYDVMVTICLSGTPYGQKFIFEADDLFVNDIDYEDHRHPSVIEMRVVDSKMRQLYLPFNTSIDVVLKCFHADKRR